MKKILYILKTFVCLFCLLSVQTGFAQNVGISSTSSFTPDASAGLDVSYTNKGLLMPRVALTATNAAGPIASPAVSLLVYNTATAGTTPNNVVPGYYYWNGTAWAALSTGAQPTNSAWSTTGNAGTTAGTNFIGTTDAKNFIVKTNNIQIADFTSNGNVAIGMDSLDATNPEKLLVHAGTTNSVNAFVAKGRINNYFQMNIKNLSSGTSATSDIVATSDNGTETSNYVDLGINGSGYTGSTIQTGKANDGYLISAGNDFYLVNSTPNKSMLFLTGGTGVAQERMRILANGRVGMGVQDPTSQFVVKDTMEIRRTGPLSQLLFTNTGGSGDLRIASDGGDLYWQGGGGRALQMGSYWTTILGGDRQGQGSAYPAYVSALGGTGVLVQSQRDASVPLAVQSFSGTQSANLTEWRNSSGTVLSTMTKDGNLGIGNTAPTEKLDVTGNLKFSGALMPNNNAGTAGYLLQSAGAGTAPVWVANNPVTAQAWGLTGNAGTTAGTNFIGTTDAKDFVIKTNNIERARISSAGDVAIGGTAFNSTNPEQLLVDAGITSSTNVISGKGSINSFLQLNIQNTSTGTNASTDVVATADNGTDAANYVDMGINSSGNKTTFYYGSANDAYLYNAGGTVGGNFYIGTSTSAKFLAFLTGGTAASNERMRIDGTGNVGIGTTAPTQKLDVTGSINAANSIYLDAANANTGTKTPGLYFGGLGSGEVIASKRTSGTNQYGIDFYTTSNLRMSVTNNGNVGIGTNTPGSKLTVAGDVAPATDAGSNLGTSTFRWSNIYAANGTIQTSDRRLKTNIKPLKYGLKEVLALKPVSYNWKDKSQPANKIGLIAQDVRKLVPEVVIGDEAKEKLGMNYAELVPVLINAIKEQQKEIDDLKKAVQKLQK